MRIQAIFLLAMAVQSVSAQSNDAAMAKYHDLLDCSIPYALERSSARLTASELATAALAACKQHLSAIHEIVLKTRIEIAENSGVRNRARMEELKSEAYASSDRVMVMYQEKATAEILRALAEI